MGPGLRRGDKGRGDKGRGDKGISGGRAPSVKFALVRRGHDAGLRHDRPTRRRSAQSGGGCRGVCRRQILIWFNTRLRTPASEALPSLEASSDAPVKGLVPLGEQGNTTAEMCQYVNRFTQL